MICKADGSIDCRKFYRVRRTDGKCNNLKNRETTNWGATAIAMRRLVSPAYGEPGKRDLHSPRKVGNILRNVTRKQFGESKISIIFSGECQPTEGVQHDAQDRRWNSRRFKGVHSHGDAVWPVPRPRYHPYSRGRLFFQENNFKTIQKGLKEIDNHPPQSWSVAIVLS